MARFRETVKYPHEIPETAEEIETTAEWLSSTISTAVEKSTHTFSVNCGDKQYIQIPDSLLKLIKF
jgi:hypothetical protein